MKRTACKLELGEERAGPADVAVARRVGAHFAELRGPVYAYAVSVVCRPDVAEDLTQDTFLRLYMHLVEGNQIENARAWVFRVCHNLAINHLKKRPRRHGRELVALDHAAANEAWENMAALEPDPEDRLLQQERDRLLETSVHTLTERQRRCLYLRAEGLRYREIAEQLDITISSVVDSLTRAVERLRKAQDGHG